MKRLLLLSVVALLALNSPAQLLTWAPFFPKENDPSQVLDIIVDATKGNQGLLNYTPASDVYVHMGVITNLSTGPTNWRYVKFNQNFNQPNAQLQATPLGNNKWKFTITGSLKDYYGVPAGETIQKIAILFRNGSGTKKQANGDVNTSDMYIPVYGSGLAVRLSQPPRDAQFIPMPETQNWSLGSSFSVSADASQIATLKLYHNGSAIASQNNATTINGTSAMTTSGNQQLVAEATAGGITTYDTLNIFAGTAPVAALPAGVRDGTNYGTDNTSVTLVLRAPGKNFVAVIGDFNNWTQNAQSVMNKTPDGKFFWQTITGLTAGTEYAYQYVVDGSVKIADPYTEKILDPNNDQYISSATYPNLKAYPTGKTTGIVSVLQTAPPAYNWAVPAFNRPDKKGLLIYELHLRDFIAAHNWNTLKDTLGYLKRLGVNAIEIMPFNEFDGNDSWGYNPTFYFAPDKYYGPKNTLKSFVDSCHKNGIAVIMDIVLNHTIGPSPLARLYWDAANNRPAANNPWYNPVQPHAFGFGDDFNHESADTKYFFNRVLQHWVTEYKLDGYRFDFSKGLTQKPSTTDAQFSAYDASRIAILKGYGDAIKAVDASAYTILEHFCDNTEEKELSDNGFLIWGNLNDSYAQASMGYSDRWDFSWGIYSTRGWTNPALVTYAESHDEERIVYKNLTYGNGSGSYNIKDTTTALKRAELVPAFLLTLPGPKMIWQFGELGYPYSINTCSDGTTISNDCRVSAKPIRWDFLNDQRRVSLFNTYSKLINLRFHPWYGGAFQTGTVDKSLGTAFKWIRLTTTNDTSDLVVMGNFDVSVLSGSITFPTAGTWYNLFDNSVLTTTATAQQVTLQPGEYRVYVNRNVNNLTTTPVGNVPWNGTSLAASIFPNPAASAFMVDMALPQSGNASLLLYNNLGQYVRTLYNGFLQKGERRLSLQRPAVAKGTYFLRLQIKDETKTLPITLQ